MIDPSAQVKHRIELLKKERKKHDPNDSSWHHLTVQISQLKGTIERYERMKREGVKF